MINQKIDADSILINSDCGELGRSWTPRIGGLEVTGASQKFPQNHDHKTSYNNKHRTL